MDTPIIVRRKRKAFVVKDGKVASSTNTGTRVPAQEDVEKSTKNNDAQSQVTDPVISKPKAPEKVKVKEEKQPQEKPEAKKSSQPKKKKPKKQKLPSFEEAMSFLVDGWPKLFSLDTHKPLKVGITKELYGVVEKGKCWRVRAAMTVYCRSEVYRKAVAEGGFRYDLEGNPVEPVSEEHQKFCREWLESKSVIKI